MDVATDAKKTCSIILKMEFEFNPDDWSYISEEAKDLIRKLLVKDAKKRICAKDVLCHPWFKKSYPTVLATPSKLRK